MKKIVLLLSVVCSLFIVSGCGNDNKSKTTNSTKEEYADKAFLEDFKQGLYDRWDFSNDSVNENIEIPEYYKALSDKELDKISKYKNEKFKDSDLHEQAIKYINNLNKSKTFDTQDYLSHEYSTTLNSANPYTKLYKERVMMINNIVKKYNIKIDSKYKEDYTNIKNFASDAIKDAEKESKINEIVDNLSFENKSKGYYEAVVENNSGYSFDSINISINLINSDGVVVDTRSDFIQNIENGQKFLIKFYANDDDTPFSSTKSKITHYELKQ
ncbi:FxLYD domain-containing protein [Enterococcus cecorum]|uniref:FxLYD domain-containing protein n=2 Tax=Enterococcus cecorum TaxID=44008 RepID=UPI001FAC4BD8|nr:FxLYD domain-containing protein [Enterococcus cecorum]MCJ0537649.1 FxLYD domain-containing protein [Enterococcus cecorum]MCJ0545535.1 FxLYD domain-containing protein [Enterococcus cecorum]MCJ0549886.1 FxLYD domain-containing protein [Enterococcus cecorum]